MKPHEETWGDDYEVTVVGPRLERHEDIQREVLARAAPEMARVLLGASGTGHHDYTPQRDEWSCHWCAHWAPLHSDGCSVGIVLKKAGVLP